MFQVTVSVITDFFSTNWCSNNDLQQILHWIPIIQFTWECYGFTWCTCYDWENCWCEPSVSYELYPSIALSSKLNIYTQFIQSLGQIHALFLTNQINGSKFYMFTVPTAVQRWQDTSVALVYSSEQWDSVFLSLGSPLWVTALRACTAGCTVILLLMVRSQSDQSWSLHSSIARQTLLHLAFDTEVWQHAGFHPTQLQPDSLSTFLPRKSYSSSGLPIPRKSSTEFW